MFLCQRVKSGRASLAKPAARAARKLPKNPILAKGTWTLRPKGYARISSVLTSGGPHSRDRQPANNRIAAVAGPATSVHIIPSPVALEADHHDDHRPDPPKRTAALVSSIRSPALSRHHDRHRTQDQTSDNDHHQAAARPGQSIPNQPPGWGFVANLPLEPAFRVRPPAKRLHELSDPEFLLDTLLGLGDAEHRFQGWTAIAKEFHFRLSR